MLKRWLPKGMLRVLHDAREKRGRRAFSQEGEDLILARYYEGRTAGFFIDVGAHHPFRFSNTYLLYRLGWRGINIDAMPGSMERFRRARPDDINVESAVGTAQGSATLFLFNEPALNTFDADLAEKRNIPPWRIVGTAAMPIRTLAELLSKHVPPATNIDFLTVDVEGRDLDVLRSNDWQRFRPGLVLAETLGSAFQRIAHDDPVVSFLTSMGYELAAKTFNTSFFLDADAASARSRR
jgi:FkbM family methyltransferase